MLNIKKVDATRAIENVQKEINTQLQLIHTKERELVQREADIKKLNDEISAIKRAEDAEKRRFDPTKDLPTLQQDVARKFKDLHAKENELARIELSIKSILQNIRSNELKQKNLDTKTVVAAPKEGVQKNKKLLEEKLTASKSLNDEIIKLQQILDSKKIVLKKLESEILILKQTVQSEDAQYARDLKNATTKDGANNQQKELELLNIRPMIQKSTVELHTFESKLDVLKVELKALTADLEKSKERERLAKSNRNQPDTKDSARQKEMTDKENLIQKQKILIQAIKRELPDLKASQIRKRDELSRLQRL